MRILIGMTRSDTMASGSFKHIVQIGERFRSEGAEVAYVIGKNGPVTQFLTDKDFKVYVLPRLERDLSLMKDLLSLLQLIWVILKFRPSLCSWHTAKIGALGRIASMLTLRRNFYVPHGIPFYECDQNKGYGKYRRLEKLLCWLPATIIGVCEFDTEQYRQLGIPKRKTLTIHNGMKPMPKRDLLIKEDEKVIFATAARFEDQKDYETLALAVRALSESVGQFELHVYGDGRKEAHVKNLFGDMVGKTVIFKGVVEDLAEKLAAAHVFLLISHWEGLPRTIIEAMSCHMPVIATDVGGVSELIEHGKTGYLVKPGDHSSIAEHMRTYIGDVAKIREHGSASLRKFRSEFTLDRMLERYVNTYIPAGKILKNVVDNLVVGYEPNVATERAERMGDV